MHEPIENLPTLKVTWHNQIPSDLLVQVGEWLELNEPDQALAYYEAAILVTPSCSLAAWRIGRIALKLHRYEYAKNRLDYALALAPDHAPTHYLLSLAYSAMSNAERALEFANSGLGISPLNDGCYLQKLRSLAELSKWQDLKMACQQATSNLHQSNELAFWQSVAAANMGHLDAARSLYSSVASKIRRKYPEFARQVETNIGQQI